MTGQGRKINLQGDDLFLGPLLLFPTGSSFHCDSSKGIVLIQALNYKFEYQNFTEDFLNNYQNDKIKR